MSEENKTYLDYFTFNLGTWFEIPLYINWSFSFVFLLCFLFGTFSACIIYSVVFFFVLLHEFGHALVAKHFGYKTKYITLTALGGMATVDSKFFHNPYHELYITIGGPMVNVVFCLIFTLFLLCLRLLPPENLLFEPLSWFFAVCASINLILFLFNAIPMFPMDGGRVLRAILHMRNKNLLSSTKYSVYTGLICAGIMICVGVFNGLWGMVIISLFLTFVSFNELEHVGQMVSAKDYREAKRLAIAYARDEVTEEEVLSAVEKIQHNSTKESAITSFENVKRMKSYFEKQ